MQQIFSRHIWELLSFVVAVIVKYVSALLAGEAT